MGNKNSNKKKEELKYEKEELRKKMKN